MSVSVFSEKSVLPDNEMLAAGLGETWVLWQELEGFIENKYPEVSGQWKHYGKASGWSWVIKSKKRSLIYMIPLKEKFRIRIVLGEKAAQQALAGDLSDQLKSTIREARAYTEGRSIDLDIDESRQLDEVKALLAIKYEN